MQPWKKWVVGIAVVLGMGWFASTTQTPPSGTPGADSSPSEAKVSEQPHSGSTVALSLNTDLRQRSLVLSGETDLPTGTLIAYEVQHEGFISQPVTEKPQLFEDGELPVVDGRYKGSVSLAGWRPGRVTVWVAFQTILGTSVKQPDEVIAKFGKMGENLTGANVTTAGGSAASIKRVQVTREIVIP